MTTTVDATTDTTRQQIYYVSQATLNLLIFAFIVSLVTPDGVHSYMTLKRNYQLRQPKPLLHQNMRKALNFSRRLAKSATVSSMSTKAATENTDDTNKSSDDKATKPLRRKKELTTAGDIRRELLRNPAPFFDAVKEAATTKKKSKSRRTRKRVDQPQQQYMYSSQRIKLQNQPGSKRDDIETADDDDSEEVRRTGTNTALVATVQSIKKNLDLILAKEYGMISSTQHCDPKVSDEAPRIVASLLVSSNSDGNDSNSKDAETITSTATKMMAYIIEKPAGWSILGGKTTWAQSNTTSTDEDTTNSKKGAPTTEMERREKYQKRIASKNDDGSFGGYMEYNELDVLALMTPEELEEENENKVLPIEQGETLARMILQRSSTSLSSSPTLLANAPSLDENNVNMNVNDYAVESTLLDESNEGSVTANENPQSLANLRRIMARANQSIDDSSKTTASFATTARPSVLSWLKDLKAAEGTPIRGGNYWTAIAGAVDVDDTGLVLICPKANANNVCIEYVEYVAVVGNGNLLDPTRGRSKADPTNKFNVDETATVESLAKLRRGRGEDVVETVKITIPERPSTCSNVIRICQEQYQDGIRGDPASSPFDRRAQRRLIHCNAMSVSSQTHDDTIEIETDAIPDDIAVLSERRNHLEYKNGSFLGRSTLRCNPLTTAYREINGAADGFPGWTVDRYGNYLLVYHDTKYPRGPLPSIHDGNTIGVYYLESNPNRSSMGSESDVRPRLLEGRPAPDTFPIIENGVTYLVSLDRDLSTGIFLDQRLHRAWLSRNCNSNTRVLNCFAHTGAFSVAAASAGASTVSLDLSKKWLDRLPEQLVANGIKFDEQHDCIYGDCFDWLVRLKKRNESYDVVILDPPSTSIGQKRKRWSIQDMDELVALAVPLVKKGGVLWTTTNSGSMPITKFSRLCHKGLVDAGILNAKLERIQPMPTDFSSIGPHPVKNLVWRIP